LEKELSVLDKNLSKSKHNKKYAVQKYRERPYYMRRANDRKERTHQRKDLIFLLLVLVLINDLAKVLKVNCK